MFEIERPKCSCGRELHPFTDGRSVLGLYGASMGVAMLCTWCDISPRPSIAYAMWSEAMWIEMEMLERGSWPRRIQGLIDDHQPHPNCRCFVFPQVDPPENQ